MDTVAIWSTGTANASEGRAGLDLETILQRAREKLPQAKPRVISDNGPQFVARDLKPAFACVA